MLLREVIFFPQNTVSDGRNNNLPHNNIDLNASRKLLKGQVWNMLLISSAVDTFSHNAARQSFYFGQEWIFSLQRPTAGACSSSAMEPTDPSPSCGMGRTES